MKMQIGLFVLQTLYLYGLKSEENHYFCQRRDINHI